jgi:6-phosphogluconate dehydrogenase (decarboxylating)
VNGTIGDIWRVGSVIRSAGFDNRCAHKNPALDGLEAYVVDSAVKKA